MGLVTTTATWTGVSVSGLTGLTIRQDEENNRSEIRWGTPAEDNQSGYDFQGSTTNASLADGEEFVLGEVTHHNYPVFSEHTQFWVNLAVSVYFADNDITHPFTLHFRHEETPNVGGYQNDTVVLPKVDEGETLYVDGAEYTVSMTGFFAKHGQNTIRTPSFDTPERRQASAKIFCRFSRTSPVAS